MKILVTGGAGFIGSAVVKALLDRGDEVVVVDNLNSYYNRQLKLDRLAQFKDRVEFYEIHISNYEALSLVFSKHTFDKVCHLAAQAGVRYSIEDPFAYNTTNVLGMLNVLELMKKHGIKDLVYASSSSVYGGNEVVPFSEEHSVDRPVSLYAATKKSNELYAHVYHHLFGFNCYGLRFFTVYGPWGRPDMALFKFTKAILADEPIDVYNAGKMKRSFSYVTDIVDGVLLSLDKVSGYEVFNLGGSDTVELLYFIECIEKAIGKTALKNMMPMQAGDVPVTFANIEKAQELLGWQPSVGIEEGVQLFVDWYKDYTGGNSGN